jgi:tetratricopeptide (TPR) repeat protein
LQAEPVTKIGLIQIRSKQMPQICLNMIVKDEARVIERCLRSVKPWIDHWLIVDTGSSDDTPQRIQAALAGVPGELVHRPWRNFGHNRTEALQLAKAKSEYLLFIDADEQLGAERGAHWPRVMDKPAYSLEARYAELSYDRVSLVSTRLDWRWCGVLHEYLDAGQPVEQPRMPGFWIQVTPDGARSGDQDKFRKDAAVLEAALLDEPSNARYVFYLAQSYRDSGQLEKARDAYARRSLLGGWEEEVWYSLYQVARLSEALGLSQEVIVQSHLLAFETRPQRAETLTALATYCRSKMAWHQAYLFASDAARRPIPTDRLFVDMSVYHWRSMDELGIAAYYTGRLAEAADCWKKLLRQPELPPNEKSRISANMAYLPEPLRVAS